MNTKLLMTASALLALCPALHAQTAPVPPAAATASAPITLRYKFVPGQVRRYAYTMNMDMHMLTGQSGAAVPMNMTMNMVMRQRVKSVRAADGAATLVTVLEGMHMLQNGKEVALPAAAKAKMTKPTTLVMLPNGKMLSMDAPGMSGLSAPGMDFGKSMFNGTGFLPDGPVKSGDTWNGAVDSAMAGVQAAYTATLTGLSAGPSGATLATIEKQNHRNDEQSHDGRHAGGYENGRHNHRRGHAGLRYRRRGDPKRGRHHRHGHDHDVRQGRKRSRPARRHAVSHENADADEVHHDPPQRHRPVTQNARRGLRRASCVLSGCHRVQHLFGGFALGEERQGDLLPFFAQQCEDVGVAVEARAVLSDIVGGDPI